LILKLEQGFFYIPQYKGYLLNIVTTVMHA